jgi:hypothetical protein
MFFIPGTYIGGGRWEGGPREVESIGVRLAEAAEVEGLGPLFTEPLTYVILTEIVVSGGVARPEDGFVPAHD